MLLGKYKSPWIEALRSGAFKQTQHVLRDEHRDGSYSYCCLGVLREVCRSMETHIDEDDDEYLLDTIQAEQIGLSKDEQSALAKMNDDGKTFAEIADHVEANL